MKKTKESVVVNENLIFLDFDGVLFDTVREAYAMATLASKKYCTLEEIDYNTNHYKNFRSLRYLVSPAWNYKYLLESLENASDIIEIKNSFLEKIKTSSQSDYIKFEETFFNIRRKIRKENFLEWMHLNIPFPFLGKITKLIHDNKDKIYIVTTKDKETVLKLLDMENIFFDKNHVFDNTDYAKYGNKKDIIKSIVKDQVDRKYVFIDDSYKHINDCLGINNLKCFQPEWGYVGEDAVTSNSKEIIFYLNKLLEE